MIGSHETVECRKNGFVPELSDKARSRLRCISGSYGVQRDLGQLTDRA